MTQDTSSSYLQICSLVKDLHSTLDRLLQDVPPPPSSPKPISVPPPPSQPIPPPFAAPSQPFVPPPLIPRATLNPTFSPYPSSVVEVVRHAILAQPVKPWTRRPALRRRPIQPYNTTRPNPIPPPPFKPTDAPLSTTFLPSRPKTKLKNVSCYQCGDKGHYASTCRSSLVCFTCGKVGHLSSLCKSKPKPSTATFTFPPSSLSTMSPVMHFRSNPATSQFRHSLSQGLILRDSRNLGAQYIQVHLTHRHHFPNWTWVARELTPQEYLIAPPNLA